MEKVHGVLIIFGFDITSSSRTDNRRNNFLVLGEGPTDFINDSTVAATKKNKKSINFRKTNGKFCLSLHDNGDESYFHVNKSEICKFRANDNINWYSFCFQKMNGVKFL